MDERKVRFIINAIETGWTVKKVEDAYVFTKKHEGKREASKAAYLEKLITEHMK